MELDHWFSNCSLLIGVHFGQNSIQSVIKRKSKLVSFLDNQMFLSISLSLSLSSLQFIAFDPLLEWKYSFFYEVMLMVVGGYLFCLVF